MKQYRLTALVLCIVLFLCITPLKALSATLRIKDNEDYPETYHFNANAANLPSEFRSHIHANGIATLITNSSIPFIIN